MYLLTTLPLSLLTLLLHHTAHNNAHALPAIGWTPACTDAVSCAEADLPTRPQNSPPSAASLTPVQSEAKARSSAITAKINHDNTAGISNGAEPDPRLPDPCGPPTQKSNMTNTCHANVTITNIYAPPNAPVSAQNIPGSVYGANCLNDDTGYTIDDAACSDSYLTICDQISGGKGAAYQATDTWIWSTQNGNCTFGYWLPKGGAPPPSNERCVHSIMGVLRENCAKQSFNVGAVNLKAMPTVEGTGKQIDAFYPSYVMVAQKSYYGVNSMDP